MAYSGNVATIVPYNESPVGVAYTADLRGLPHTVDVRFTQPGPAVVRARGRDSGSATWVSYEAAMGVAP